MIVGGLLGSVVGAALFRLLQSTGQIDIVIGSLYVLILGWIGSLMLKDALIALGYRGSESHRRRQRRATTAGRLAAAALALLQFRPLHLAARAARARLCRWHADRPPRHRRRLHPRARDDLPARHAGAGGDRHQPCR